MSSFNYIYYTSNGASERRFVLSALYQLMAHTPQPWLPLLDVGPCKRWRYIQLITFFRVLKQHDFQKVCMYRREDFFCLTKRVGAVVYHTQQGLLHLTSDSVRCAYLIRFQLAAMVPGTSKNIMMLIDHIDTCCSIEHKSWMKLVKQDVKMPHDTAEVQLLQVFWWLVLLGLLLEAPSITASTHHCINWRQWLASGGLASLWDSPLGYQGTFKPRDTYVMLRAGWWETLLYQCERIEITRVSPIDITIDYFMNIATSSASFVHVSLPLISTIQWCWMILNSTVRSISEGRDSSDCRST